MMSKGLRKLLAQDDIEQDFYEEIVAFTERLAQMPDRKNSEVIFYINQIARKRNDRMRYLAEA